MIEQIKEIIADFENDDCKTALGKLWKFYKEHKESESETIQAVRLSFLVALEAGSVGGFLFDKQDKEKLKKTLGGKPDATL